jgi:hypothetical protein
VADPFCYDGANHLGSNDCYDASTVAAVYFDGSCDTRRLRTATTTVPKPTSGCGSTVYYGSPYTSSDCNNDCYDAALAAVAEYYDGSCGTRRLRDKTVTPNKSTNGCPDKVSYSAPYASPTCEGACTTADTAEFSADGYSFSYTGTPGYFAALIEEVAYKTCTACGPGYYRYVTFYVTTCNGTRTITAIDCDVCFCFFC